MLCFFRSCIFVAISNELTLVIESSNKNAAHAKGMLELLKKESAEKKKDKATPLSEIRSVRLSHDLENGDLHEKAYLCLD